jgi:crotonobetainyl-CoA:carnitine CoA-transferase CaiB-like acyl-CoA transferase
MLRESSLENIWVIDFTCVWAGPFTTRILADFGAKVIKVESIQHPDLTRYLHQPSGSPGDKPYNRGGYFHQFHRNKYGITLDLSRSRGKGIMMQLVRRCDVFVENYSPRVARNLGLTYEELTKVNPRIIVLSLHGYGNSGPYSDMPAFGSSAEALSGFRSLVGYGDGIPISPGTTTADPVASLHSAFAILAALTHRQETGRGQLIDVSIHESIACIMEEAILEYTVNKREPHQLGARHHCFAPYGFYRCKGDYSWIAISVTSDEEWAALCRVIGNPTLASERFSDALSRWQNQDELDYLINEWTIQHESHEAMNILQEARVAAGACLNAQDVLNDPHLNERDCFWLVTSPDTGTYPLIGPVVKLSETPATLRLPPPALGEHNQYVLEELLGIPSKEIAALKEEEIIGDAPAY